MKKIMILVLLLVSLVAGSGITLKGNDYQSFEKLEIVNAKLLSKWTDTEKKAYETKLKPFVAFGWDTYYVARGARVTFVSETKYSIKNNGYTPMKLSYDFGITEKSKYDMSVTGSLKLKIDGKTKAKSFDGGLDAQIKKEVSYTTEVTKAEKFSVDTQIDPGTSVIVIIRGEGRLYNGVSRNNFFFCEIARGGFEVFAITSTYYHMEKRKN